MSRCTAPVRGHNSAAAAAACPACRYRNSSRSSSRYDGYGSSYSPSVGNGGSHANSSGGGGGSKPFVQSLYIEMAEHPDHPPSPIHLILRAGCNVILQFLERLSAVCQPCGFEFQVRRTRCRSGGGRSWPRNFAAT